MKAGITRFMMVAAIAALAVVGGSTAAWASCPTAPGYLPDFTSNQGCLSTNGSATFPAPVGSPATVTSWSGTGGLVTFQGSNSFVGGELITLSSFTSSTFFNGLTFPVLSAGLTATTFEVAFSGYSGSSDTGVATPTQVLQLTPATTFVAGSAWFSTQQPVAAAFSTTFTFQLSGGNTSDSPADGIAFVIQNSPASPAPGAMKALGPDGCGIGFGADTVIGCTSGSGITNSLAVEFNTYFNGGIDPSNNDVTIQNCLGTGPNSVDPGCSIALNDLTQLPNPINMADGNIHSATITYAPPAASGCGTGGLSACPSSLDVILDNTDLFPAVTTGNNVHPAGVAFLMTSISLNNDAAYVGFTSATGGGDDNQDIVSWTFTPGTQSAAVTSAAPATLPFQNAVNANVYDYTAQVTTGTQTVQITPILMTQSACNAIVQKSFRPAHCFVYEDAENTGMDAAVMFEVTCPQAPGGTCSGTSFQELGTDFEFLQSENPLFVYPGIFGPLNPFPGWLKGDGGPDPLHPCTPPTTGALFQSNQVSLFFIDGGTTKGKSKGGASCWVATYDTPGESLPRINITTPTPTIYTQSQVVLASYTCSDPATSQPDTSLTGPYLTAASCTQSELIRSGFNTNTCSALPSPITCTGPVDTSTTGLHTFLVTSIDSGGNTNVQAVVYTVKKK